jgi:glycosyltransferase involved in cell wall biosynthesis
VKVAMVVPGGVDRSGTERVIPFLLAMVERVAARHELHVFALRQEERPGSWPLLGATVHNLGGRRPTFPAIRAVMAEHRRGAFDVVHGVWVAGGLVAGTAARLLRRPALLHLVGGDAAAVPEIGYGLQCTRRGRMWLHAAARMASYVTAESGYTVRLAAGRGVTAERVPYGVSVRDWPALPPRRRDPDAPARLLFVGNLNEVKDPRTLVRAAAALRDRHVAFQLDVIGLDTLNGEIQRRAEALGLNGTVRFHGWKPQSELRPWMEQADVLLLASRHEGLPVVALEAALAGVPTVGPRVGLLDDWAPEAAVLVPTADPCALADAVAALLADETRRLRIARAAQRRALREDADHAAARVLEIYDTLTRSGRAA